MYTIKICYYRGETDCYNVKIKQDRYSVLNPQGFDEFGEHMNLKDALNLCTEYNLKLAKDKKINFNKRKTAFKTFLISSNVLKLGANKFQTQCTQYGKTFDLKSLFTYYKNEYDYFNK